MNEQINIQEVFNKVIQNGLYGPKTQWGLHGYVIVSEFMCVALAKAEQRGLISHDEKIAAEGEIMDYLRTATNATECLETVLQWQGMRSEYHYRRVIYENWANRPAFRKL